MKRKLNRTPSATIEAVLGHVEQIYGARASARSLKSVRGLHHGAEKRRKLIRDRVDGVASRTGSPFRSALLAALARANIIGTRRDCSQSLHWHTIDGSEEFSSPACSRAALCAHRAVHAANLELDRLDDSRTRMADKVEALIALEKAWVDIKPQTPAKPTSIETSGAPAPASCSYSSY